MKFGDRHGMTTGEGDRERESESDNAELEEGDQLGEKINNRNF